MDIPATTESMFSSPKAFLEHIKDPKWIANAIRTYSGTVAVFVAIGGIIKANELAGTNVWPNVLYNLVLEYGGDVAIHAAQALVPPEAHVVFHLALFAANAWRLQNIVDLCFQNLTYVPFILNRVDSINHGLNIAGNTIGIFYEKLYGRQAQKQD